MFLTLSKLEFKRGYFGLYRFLVFFVFSNFSQILKEFKTNNEVFVVVVVVFSSNKSDINDSIYSNIVKELKIDKFEKITGEEILKELDLYSELNRLIDENLKSYLPVGIRFTIESFNQPDEIKKILNSIEKNIISQPT